MYLRQAALHRFNGGGKAFETLVAFLNTFGTPIIFAPYYDPSRVDTGTLKTYDINGSGDYLTLTGAVFDPTTKGMVFDGIDDHALSANTLGKPTALCALVLYQQVGLIGAYGHIIHNGYGVTGGNLQIYAEEIKATSTIFSRQSSTKAYVDIRDSRGGQPNLLSLFWNGSTYYGFTNASAFDIIPSAENASISDGGTTMCLGASPTGASSFSSGTRMKGTIHAVVYFQTSSTAQMDALRAGAATYQNLFKAAFPWAGLA